MDVQAHDRLMTMVDDGELRFAAADPLRVCRLRREAQAHLLWARASDQSGDRAGAFRLACRAGVEECVAVLLSVGLQAVEDDGGRTVLRAVTALVDAAPTRRAVRRADDLRRALAAAEAGARRVERVDVKEAIAVAETLGRHLTEVVEQRYPGMLANRAG